MWLRHAPAPLLWIHPIAKNHVLMPKGDSNAIFDSSGIFIVGTCPPMKMVGKFAFFDSLSRPAGGGIFVYPAKINKYPLTAVRFLGMLLYKGRCFVC